MHQFMGGNLNQPRRDFIPREPGYVKGDERHPAKHQVKRDFKSTPYKKK